MNKKYEHHYGKAGNFTLHYVSAGSGPTILLLHGFPDFWYTWKNQILELADKGYCVVAVDLPGYNLSSKSEDFEDFRVPNLCETLHLFIKDVLKEPVYLVGHDWGGVLTWFLTMHYPEDIKKTAVLNILHPERFFYGFTTISQRIKSFYAFAFQVPEIPEKVFSARDYSSLKWLFQHEPVTPFSNKHVERYKTAFRRPLALNNAINYYRWLIKERNWLNKHYVVPTQKEVLILFGDKDIHLNKSLVEPKQALVPNRKIIHYSNATHWIQHDIPEEVNKQLLAWFMDEE